MTYLTAITYFHTAISLVAIPLGIFAVARLFNRALARRWTNLFMLTAFLTSATGFLFPFFGITPAFIVGVVALVILAAMVWAYGRVHDGALYRWICAGGMVASLYLLVFVLIVQAFQKIPALNQFAPTGSEPPFAIVQGITLLIFLGVGIQAARRYRP
jgi:hypothetical protein